MPSFNRVILMGNLTRDPDVREVGVNAVKVCRFSLAMNERRKDRNGNLLDIAPDTILIPNIYTLKKAIFAAIGADKEGNEITLADTLESPEGDVAVKVERRECDSELMRIVSALLDDREYTILQYRFGLNDAPVLPQREIAKKLEISRSYISRIESKVLAKLKKYLIENEIDL